MCLTEATALKLLDVLSSINQRLEELTERPNVGGAPQRLRTLSAKEVAAQLRVSTWTVDRLRRAKKLRGVNISGSRKSNWRFRPCDVEEFIASNVTGPPVAKKKVRSKFEPSKDWFEDLT